MVAISWKTRRTVTPQTRRNCVAVSARAKEAPRKKTSEVHDNVEPPVGGTLMLRHRGTKIVMDTEEIQKEIGAVIDSHVYVPRRAEKKK